MKTKSSLLGLFLLLTLVVAACGGAATAPEAAMEKESKAVVKETGSQDAMMGGESNMMKDDSDAMMKEDDSDTMAADDSDAMKKEDSDTMADDDSDAMAKGDSTDGMVADHSDSAMDTDNAAMSTDSDMGMDGEAMMELPNWFSAALTDVNTGQTFTISDLQDKVILVETMAIWCSNCLRQQQEVKALHEALGMEEDLVTLVLDIDPNEDADNLSAYTAKHGFEWTYAVAPREVAREIGQLYGDQFLNPPSTPMLIIDRHGEAHLLPFGRKTAQDLQEALDPFLNGEM